MFEFGNVLDIYGELQVSEIEGLFMFLVTVDVVFRRTYCRKNRPEETFIIVVFNVYGAFFLFNFGRGGNKCGTYEGSEYSNTQGEIFHAFEDETAVKFSTSRFSSFKMSLTSRPSASFTSCGQVLK